MSGIGEIRERLARLEESTKRIEGKIDHALGLEPRVRKLEAWRNFLTGAIAIVASAVGATMRQH